jgi:hypothetical protein
MGRPPNPDLTKDWKLPLPASLAGAVEFELLDPLTNKPRYGQRSKLVTHLLAVWLASRGKRIEIDPPDPDLCLPEGTLP